MLSSEASMNRTLFAIKHQRSLITYHYNKYNNNEKVCNTARISKMWHREMKWENVIRKTAPKSLTLLSQTFIKNSLSVKHNKTTYAYIIQTLTKRKQEWLYINISQMPSEQRQLPDSREEYSVIIKWLIHQEDSNLNVYASNSKASKYMN